MGYGNQTDLGGSQEAFLTTQWSLIDSIKAGKDRDQTLIGFLLEKYWKPVYCFLRRQGHGNESAKDLTQAFFHEVVLNRNLVARADQTKGRFRSFLLHALKQFITRQGLKERARKRIPPEKLIPLDLADATNLPVGLSEAAPEASFHYAWLSAILERVVKDVRTSCENEGMEKHWALFQERFIGPILHDQSARSLDELCNSLEIKDAKTASNMIITVKRRYKSALLAEVRRTILSHDRASEELADLMAYFPKGVIPSDAVKGGHA